jgi:DNA polymerase III epsilon subunit-like protein
VGCSVARKEEVPLSSRIFVFDLETTGVKHTAVPFQIAGVILDPNVVGLPQVGEFHEFMKIPSYALPFVESYAMNLHAQKGWTLDWIQTNGKAPATVYEALRTFLLQFGKFLTPAGHNATGFDMPMLNREMLTQMGADFKLPLSFHVLDTMAEAIWTKTLTGAPPKVNLADVSAHWGVPFNKEAAHDALYDVKATAAVLRNMLHARGGIPQ